MYLRKIAIAFAVAALYCSCNVNTTFTNRKADRDAAESVSNQLFNDFRQEKYDDSFKLYSEKFWEVSPKDSLRKVYSMSQRYLGKMLNTEVGEWETRVIEGTNSSADYLFRYNSKYEKGEAVETLHLIKDTDGKIRIASYNISSNNFLRQ